MMWSSELGSAVLRSLRHARPRPVRAVWLRSDEWLSTSAMRHPRRRWKRRGRTEPFPPGSGRSAASAAASIESVAAAPNRATAACSIFARAIPHHHRLRSWLVPNVRHRTRSTGRSMQPAPLTLRPRKSLIVQETGRLHRCALFRRPSAPRVTFSGALSRGRRPTRSSIMENRYGAGNPAGARGQPLSYLKKEGLRVRVAISLAFEFHAHAHVCT